MTAIAEHNTTTSADYVALDEEWSTHNYHPLPVVISHGEGSWVTVGVGHNIVEASWEALSDGYLYGLLHADDAAPAKPTAGQLAAANG